MDDSVTLSEDERRVWAEIEASLSMARDRARRNCGGTTVCRGLAIGMLVSVLTLGLAVLAGGASVAVIAVASAF